jgi:exonuclease VII large subunit
MKFKKGIYVSYILSTFDNKLGYGRITNVNQTNNGYEYFIVSEDKGKIKCDWYKEEYITQNRKEKIGKIIESF